ncbi:MAG: phosphotransferase enzyme family protein, partial [Anaerolineae bacterium]
ESDGVIYAYPHGDRRRLLKIMAIPADNERRGLLNLDERLKFMSYLGKNGAHVAFPRPSPQDDLYEITRAEGHVWVAYVMDLAPGRTPAQDLWDENFFRNWGRTIGQLHHLARAYPSWRSSTDPETGEPFLTWEEEWISFYDWCQDEEVRAAWVALKGQLDALPVTRDAFGFIHNDPHIWNLHVDGDRITVLDFDVANHHWFMTDIGIAMQSVLIFLTGGFHGPVRDRGRLMAFLDCFTEGYAGENSLSAAWWNRLDLFIAYRRILLYIVMGDWRRSQPDLDAAWKAMILSSPEVVGPRW